jgi:hypothetical protein
MKAESMVARKGVWKADNLAYSMEYGRAAMMVDW